MLRQDGREAVERAAAEYRELRAEHPDALRTIADAYQRISDEAAELAVLRTLIVRGQATSSDKLRALRVALELDTVDDKTYAAGLTWLDEALVTDPWCASFALLVQWTAGRPEHDASIERALAGCPRDHERAAWFALRAERSGDAEDACNAVVHGEHALARRCITGGRVPWKLAVARAMLEAEPSKQLAGALTASEITPHVLLMYAAAPAVPRDDACAALARARTIETGWLPRAGSEAGIAGRYAALRQQRSCP